MKEDADFLIDDVCEPEKVFRELIKLFAPSNPVITIWWSGRSKYLKKELLEFETKTNILRKLIFKERNYLVTLDNMEQFVNRFSNDIIKEISWGMLIGNSSIILARAYDDISIDNNKFKSNEEIGSILQKLRIDGHIKTYEVIED